MRVIIGILLMLFLNACLPNEERQVVKDTYPDLKGFFEKEIKRLNSRQAPFKKQIFQNGKVESKILDSINFSSELELFSQIDLNKSAWKNAFRFQKNNLGDTTIKTFTCKDPKVRIREVSVFFLKNQIVKVQSFFTSKNNIYSSFLKLEYLKDKKFEIVSGQQIRWMEGNYFFVRGCF